MKTDISLDNLRQIDRAYSNIEPHARFMPAVYQIEPTNDCNLDCLMCPNHEIESKTYLTLNTFRNILDQVGDYAQGVRLNYLGEPLLHPEIVDMIDYAKARSKAKVTLFTNATLLTHKIAVDLVRSGLDEIVFSVDADTALVFQQIRRLANYENVVGHIEDFLLFKNDRKPRAAVNFVKLGLNDSEMQSVRDHWARFRCDVYFSPMCTWRSSRVKSRLGLRESRISSDRSRCADLWYKAVIGATGDVLFCCNDYLSTYSLGNAGKRTIFEIWNSEAITQARKWQLNGEFEKLPLCYECEIQSTRESLQGFMVGSSIVANRP